VSNWISWWTPPVRQYTIYVDISVALPNEPF
jgi:hypothetical protein